MKVRKVEASIPLPMQPRAACEVCSWSVSYGHRTLDRARTHAATKNHRVAIIEETVTNLQPVDHDLQSIP